MDEELVTYATAVGVENVDLNDYYAIDYSKQDESNITYVANDGTTEVSDLINWNDDGSTNHNLNLHGSLVNTGAVEAIPPINPQMSSDSSSWIITTLFAILILAAILMALYSSLKPKQQVQS